LNYSQLITDVGSVRFIVPFEKDIMQKYQYDYVTRSDQYRQEARTNEMQYVHSKTSASHHYHFDYIK